MAEDSKVFERAGTKRVELSSENWAKVLSALEVAVGESSREEDEPSLRQLIEKIREQVE